MGDLKNKLNFLKKATFTYDTKWQSLKFHHRHYPNNYLRLETDLRNEWFPSRFSFLVNSLSSPRLEFDDSLVFFLGPLSSCTAKSLINDELQGQPLGIDIMYLVLVDRNMQVRFGLKVVWES